MELTERAKKEIKKLEAKMEDLHREKIRLEIKMESSDFYIIKLLIREKSKVINKIDRIRDKINYLQEVRIASSEESSIKKQAFGSDFTTIEVDKSLGTKTYRKIGFSKALNQYVEVEVTRYGGFLSNVKGCKSLANTVSLNDFKVITEKEYNKKMNGKKKIHTSFMGVDEVKEVPISSGV